MLQGDKSKWLDPNLSTLGNPSNSYTSKGAHPVIYDYVWYRSAKEKTISVANYQVTCPKVVDWSFFFAGSTSHHWRRKGCQPELS